MNRKTKQGSPALPKRAPAAKPRVAKPVRAKASAAKPKTAKSKVAKPKVAKPKAAAPARKPETVRDSFNMPVEDYGLIGAMKKRALGIAVEVRKSELLRAGLRMLSSLGDDAFKAALAAVPAVKKGRPGKKKK
jgi:hypothetical protein